MFATAEATIDHALERRRAARLHEWRALCESEARIAQRKTQLVREFDRERDWEAAGCTSNAAWVAQISSSDYRTAARITKTSEALRDLPALDHALETGALSLDQVAAAAEFATPETDREIARAAVGRAPREVGRVSRTLAPPKVADDAELYRRRELRMAWTRGHRELAISGRLPLEHGVDLRADHPRHGEAAAGRRQARRRTSRSGSRPAPTRSSRSPRPAAAPTAARATLIVHVAEGEPPFIEGAGPISPETAERLTCDARRLTIKRHGRDLVHSRVGRCASYAQLRALHLRDRHCRYPGCTVARELRAHHLRAWAREGETVLDNLILLCSRHHTRVHDHHIRTSGSVAAPVFTDASGRVITVARPHAPPG